MYKVFLNDSFLIISNHIDISLNATVKNFESIEQVNKWIKDAEQSTSNYNLVLMGKNEEEIWNQVVSHFGKIGAAGGLIKKNDRFLFIFRRGKWDLPKGKIDKGEEPWQTALREVEEETGLHGMKIIQSLPSTYHMYRLKDKMVIKETFWYLMNYEGDENPVPQTIEDIEKIEWLTIDEFNQLSGRIFGTVKDLIEYYVEAIM